MEEKVKRKITWLVASCLMVAVLVLASCAPVAVEEETAAEEEEVASAEEETTVEEEEVASAEEEEVATAAGEPIYGGTFYPLITADVVNFDEAYCLPWDAWTMGLTNEEPMTGNWGMGPAGGLGTNEVGWFKHMTNFLDFEVPCLVESWDLPDKETCVLHVRKGVYFQDKPPVNGREMDAHDIVFSLNRLYFEVSTAYLYTTVPEDKKPTSITATDKWTVVIKCPAAYMGINLRLFSDCAKIVPYEMIDEYGDLQDWENACGTGPFLLTDYVPMSSVSLKRNPNYWGTDPFRPQNKLPYIDAIEALIIQDESTQLAAIRTGKADFIHYLGWEDAEALKAKRPDVKIAKYLKGNSWAAFMRLDKPELPFGDIRVRQALSMAIDRQGMIDDLYGGNAVLIGQPIPPYGPFLRMYTPLEELPEKVQEIYTYNPEKAKELLAEAGYPNGFESQIICLAPQQYVDMVTIMKECWAAIGVDVRLDVKEAGVWNSITAGRTHEEMSFRYCNNDTPSKLLDFLPESLHNQSIVDDPHLNEVNQEIIANIAVNDEKVFELMEEITPYILEQCWMIDLPLPYDFTAWWPWVGNFNGEYSIGYLNMWNFPKYIWIDEELKESMGY